MPRAGNLRMGCIGVQIPHNVRPGLGRVAAKVDVRTRAPALGDIIRPKIGVVRRLAFRFTDLPRQPRHTDIEYHRPVRTVTRYGACKLSVLDLGHQSRLTGSAEVDLDRI